MGDKGIYSSVVDLYKWDQAIYSHSLLPRHVWEQAFEPALLQNQRTVNYGQGWRLQTFLDGRIVHHPGRWGGFRTSFKRFIDNKGTLIMLSNNDRDITPLVEGMQNIIFQQEILLFSEKPAEDTLPYEEESDGS
jgi:CubicO group peptidase (beta-lactamase class C family)